MGSHAASQSRGRQAWGRAAGGGRQEKPACSVAPAPEGVCSHTPARARTHALAHTRPAARARAGTTPPRSAARERTSPAAAAPRPRATPPPPRPAKAIGRRTGAAPGSRPAARRRGRATQEGAPRVEAPGARAGAAAGGGRRPEATQAGGGRAATTGRAGALRRCRGSHARPPAGAVGSGGRAAATAPQARLRRGPPVAASSPGAPPAAFLTSGVPSGPPPAPRAPRPRRAPRSRCQSRAFLFWGRPAAAPRSLPARGELAPQAQPGPGPSYLPPGRGRGSEPREERREGRLEGGAGALREPRCQTWRPREPEGGAREPQGCSRKEAELAPSPAPKHPPPP